MFTNTNRPVCEFFENLGFNTTNCGAAPALGAGIVLGATAVSIISKSKTCQKVLRVGQDALSVSLFLATPIAACAAALYAGRHSAVLTNFFKNIHPHHRDFWREQEPLAFDPFTLLNLCFDTFVAVASGFVAGATTYVLSDVVAPSGVEKKLTEEELKLVDLKAAEGARPGGRVLQGNNIQLLGQLSASVGVDGRQ